MGVRRQLRKCTEGEQRMRVEVTVDRREWWLSAVVESSITTEMSPGCVPTIEVRREFLGVLPMLLWDAVSNE